MLLLGLDAPEAELIATFALAARHRLCEGFAVGRTIFSVPAEARFAGDTDDAAATTTSHATYRRLIDAWERA